MVLSQFSGGLFFLSLLGFALLLMLLFPKLKMGAALLSALCCMLFVSYVGVILLDLAVPVAYGLMGGGLACLAALLPLTLMNRRNLRSRVFSVPFWAYLFLSGLFVFLTYGKAIGDHDELSFWARAVKELFILNGSYFQAGTNMFHMDYIPLAASLQYSIVRVFGWQDAFLSYMHIACMITAVCAAADLIHKKGYSVFFIGLALLYYPSLSSVFGPHQLNADGPLSMIFWSALLCLCCREDASPSSLLPALSAIAILPGMKIYSGLLFAVLLTLLLLWGAKKERSIPAPPSESAATSEKNPLRIPVRFAIVACCLMLFTQFSWSGHYQFQSRKMVYEERLLRAAYRNEAPPEGISPPVLTLGDVFAGNPRTSRLTGSLNEESFRQVARLIRTTFTMYQNSRLPATLLFLLPLLWVAWQSKGRERKDTLALLFALLAACAIYTIGLFAGYFVQAEIYTGSMHYLSTVHMPLILTALFVCVRCASVSQNRAGRGAAACLLGSIIALIYFFQPAHFPVPRFEPTQASVSYMRHAESFWNEEAAGLFNDEDLSARAVLMDATWDASRIRSKSGITHAYYYTALPMRLFAWQFEWGNADKAESMTRDFLTRAVLQDRGDILIIRTDDELYQDAFASALGVEADVGMPWVFDVGWEDGEVVFAMRE